MKHRTTTHYESHMRRLRLYALPIINFVLISFPVFLALSRTSIDLPNTAVIIITLFTSLIAVFIITLVEQIVIALPAKYRNLKAVIISLLFVLMPMMYLYEETTFYGEKTFLYHYCFALISMLIQLIALIAYMKQLKLEEDSQAEKNCPEE